MKRFLLLTVTLILLLAMAACGGNSNPPTTDPSTEPTESKIKTKVADPLSWDDIEAIPIANDSMTEDELRQICVDFMRLQLTFGWTPSHDVVYSNGSGKKGFLAGEAYGGIPYISVTMGNIYTAVRYVDPDNGVIDTSAGPDVFRYFSNQCSGSTFWGWVRVSNTLKYSGTSNCIEANGCLRIGDYIYDSSIYDFHKQKISTIDICKDNGTTTMYESYAKMKLADGLVTYQITDSSSAGHVMMVSAVPNVVRNADGTIDGEKSTVTIMDQMRNWNKQTQPDGTTYEIEGSLDVPWTFSRLFSAGYLPFTIPEFHNIDPVEKGEVSINYTGSSVSVSKLASCKLTSNYAISDISLSVKDSNGKEVYTKTVSVYRNGLDTCYMPVSLSSVVLKPLLNPYVDGKHTVEISARIGTGEKLVAFSGDLMS